MRDSIVAIGLNITGGGWLQRWRRNPLLPLQLFVTIAVGMGTAAALVSLMLSLGFQPLPFRDPGQLVAVWERVDSGAPIMAISGPDISDFADGTREVFSAFGAFSPARKLWLSDRRGAAEIPTCYIQAGIFSDLGIRPILGRAVTPDDEPAFKSASVKNASAPVWISYRLWQSRYGGSPSVIGAPVGLDVNSSGPYKLDMRIAGVLPPGVNLPLPFMEGTADVWYLAEPNLAGRPREGTVFFGLGRLRPGVTVARAQSALAVVARRLEQSYQVDRRKRPVVEGLESIAQAPARQTMGLLVLGVGLVFLVGCVNLAILMGAEGRQRRREIAIRIALGANARRLWCEVASEKCLLTLLSLGAGVGFAAMLLRVLAQLLPAAGLGPPLLHPPPLNLAILFGFTSLALAVSLAWSALLVSASDGARKSRGLAATDNGLGYAGFSDSSPSAGRWRLLLLVSQAGVGICLLAAAALAAKTYINLSTANLGPEPRHTVVLSVTARDNFVPSDAQVANFNQELLSRLERLPGTEAIALADVFPPPGDPVSFRKEGDGAEAERAATYPISVSPGYFRALGIPILFGRTFETIDSSHGEPAAIISLDMARRNWDNPAQSIGSHITFGPKSENHYKVVGVAADFTGYWSNQPVPTVYLPEAQSVNWCGEVIVRTSAPFRTVATLVPQILHGMTIPVTISDISTIHDHWQATLTRPLARMAGMVLLALLGLGLSVQGAYALAAGTVTARRHELAVRAALGAPPGRLVWDITRELVLSVLLGAGLGVVAVFELRPLLVRLVGETTAWPTQPIIIAVMLLAMAAALGCYTPARAAMRTNPIDVLRQG